MRRGSLVVASLGEAVASSVAAEARAMLEFTGPPDGVNALTLVDAISSVVASVVNFILFILL